MVVSPIPLKSCDCQKLAWVKWLNCILATKIFPSWFLKSLGCCLERSRLSSYVGKAAAFGTKRSIQMADWKVMVTGKRGKKTAYLSGRLDGAAFSWWIGSVLSLPFTGRWMLRRGRMESALLVYLHDNAYQSGARKRNCASERTGK